MERVAVHNSGKLREATLNGKKYIVARATLIVPGVLSGSQGALYYPPEEVAQNVDAWNGMPLVLGHPTNNGAHVSARSPDVVERFGLGYVFNAQIRKGRLVAETWFDVAQTERNAPQVLNKLRKGQPVELSTGLFTVNHPAGKGAVYNGKAYQYVARSYRPDHLAILVDQPGACSLKDGCGVLANNCDCEACATKNELSGAKACEIARDGTVHGKKLTKKQKGLFGAKCGESKENRMTGNCGGKGGKPGPCPSGDTNKTDERRVKSSKVTEQQLDAETDALMNMTAKNLEKLLGKKVRSGEMYKERLVQEILMKKYGKDEFFRALGIGKTTNNFTGDTSITKKQKGLFGAKCGESKENRMTGNCGGKGGKPGPCPEGTARNTDHPLKGKSPYIYQSKPGDTVTVKTDPYTRGGVYKGKTGKIVKFHSGGSRVEVRFEDGTTSKFEPSLLVHNSGDTSMTKKDKMVRYLTANCECWKGKDDAKTLAALPDEKLKALVDNAKRAKESAELVESIVGALSEGEEQPITANELPTLVANMKAKANPFAKAPAEESEDAGEEMAESDMEEQKEGHKPTFMKNAKKKGKYGMSLNQERDEERAAPTLNEWLESAPPEVRSVIANAQRIEHKQKLEIVSELVGNSRAKTKADKEALHKLLMAKPLDELQTLNQLAPAPRKVEPAVNSLSTLLGREVDRVPDYSGLGEVDELTANELDEDDTTLEDAPLPIPTVNWAEEAKLTLPGRERK